MCLRDTNTIFKLTAELANLQAKRDIHKNEIRHLRYALTKDKYYEDRLEILKMIHKDELLERIHKFEWELIDIENSIESLNKTAVDNECIRLNQPRVYERSDSNAMSEKSKSKERQPSA
ncbi:hypothetical protein AGMMS49990_02140 [Endomicrobiia bacterium]|nr:hypothetical protein AGMMS49990_02140 [Endomicrobiia bacterium]